MVLSDTKPLPLELNIIILAEMLVKNILVTGANRGLGLEFVRQFLLSPNPPERLVATYRDPSTSKDLLELAKSEPTLHIIQLDVTDSRAFPDLVSRLDTLVGDSGLNLLINNAGYKESELRDLETVTEEQMVKHFRVNCIAPLLLTRYAKAVMLYQLSSSSELSCLY